MHLDPPPARVVGVHLVVAPWWPRRRCRCRTRCPRRGRTGCARAPAGAWGWWSPPGRAPRASVTRPLGATAAISSFPCARLGQRRGREAVEAAVAYVLGQVHALPARVHRGGLVLEDAHRRAGHRTPAPPRVALPHAAAIHLLAGEPGAPRRRPAGAVDVRVRRGSGRRRGSPPLLSKRIAPAPPPTQAGASQFDTRIQPPSRVG